MLKRITSSVRTLFSLTSSSSPAQCSTSSLSHLTYRHSHGHPDSRNVGVKVYWDYENCPVPSGVSASRVAPAITAAVESSGIKGPIEITAFGDVAVLERTNEEAFSSTEITFRHVPEGGADDRSTSLHRSLTTELLNFSSQTPPPVHLFLITGDTQCAMILHRLRMQNYNILLASKQPVHCLLSSAASIMWDWDALVRDGNITGRYFNQSPDSSRYGHYEGPIEDPFTVIHRPSY